MSLRLCRSFLICDSKFVCDHMCVLFRLTLNSKKEESLKKKKKDILDQFPVTMVIGSPLQSHLCIVCQGSAVFPAVFTGFLPLVLRIRHLVLESHTVFNQCSCCLEFFEFCAVFLLQRQPIQISKSQFFLSYICQHT